MPAWHAELAWLVPIMLALGVGRRHGGEPVPAVGKLALNLVAAALLAVLASQTRRRWRSTAGATGRASGQSRPRAAWDPRQ